LGEKEELDKRLDEKNIQIARITECKRKLQGTKNTKNCTVIYSAVNRNLMRQTGDLDSQVNRKQESSL
jgi:hypothetical protein